MRETESSFEFSHVARVILWRTRFSGPCFIVTLFLKHRFGCQESLTLHHLLSSNIYWCLQTPSQNPEEAINQYFSKYNTGGAQREREKRSLRCIRCKWAPLNLLANGKWFSMADWLIRPWQSRVCCSVSSPWHHNLRKQTLSCCTLAPCTPHSSHYKSAGLGIGGGLLNKSLI